MLSATELVHAIMLDIYPTDSPAAMVDYELCDFLLNETEIGKRRYNALHYAVRRNGITAEQLHSALLSHTLTELVRNNNPDQEVSWEGDEYGDEDEEDDEYDLDDEPPF